MKPTMSRRALLRRTAALTTGVVAAGTISAGSKDPAYVDVAEGRAGSRDPADASPAIARDHDPETGEIFDRDRHHQWDTV